MISSIKEIRKVLQRQFFRTSRVWWANGGPVTRLAATLFPFSDNPVLLLGLPRSGSSWLGEMIGHSSRALYLREPLTQSYLQNSPDQSTVAEVLPNRNGRVSAYERAASLAFRGIPAFDGEIVPVRSQWLIRGRHERSLIIKEVNPLALRWLSNNFEFRLIYLVRHPAAIAASWQRLNWSPASFDDILGPQLRDQVNGDHERQFWTWHGALQALVHKYVYSELASWHPDQFRVITYERLCTNSQEVIAELFRFAGLPWTNGETQRVHRSTIHSTDRIVQAYSTKRISRTMPYKWRSDLKEDEIDLLRDAYQFYNPPIYSEDW